jgi:hypothetical protein
MADGPQEKDEKLEKTKGKVQSLSPHKAVKDRPWPPRCKRVAFNLEPQTLIVKDSIKN